MYYIPDARVCYGEIRPLKLGNVGCEGSLAELETYLGLGLLDEGLIEKRRKKIKRNRRRLEQGF